MRPTHVCVTTCYKFDKLQNLTSRHTHTCICRVLHIEKKRNAMTIGHTHVCMSGHAYRETQKSYDIGTHTRVCLVLHIEKKRNAVTRAKHTHTCVCLVCKASKANEGTGRDPHTRGCSFVIFLFYYVVSGNIQETCIHTLIFDVRFGCI
jgi:hypothetical protein